MAFKLTKDEYKTRDQHIAALTEAREELEKRAEDLNEAIQTAADALRDALESYTEKLEEARNFCADIVSQAQEDFADKSERWQEGDRGSVVQDWINEWENALNAEPEIEVPNEVSLDFDDHAAELDALPPEAE